MFVKTLDVHCEMTSSITETLLTLESDFILCMIAISTLLKQVKVLVVSALNMTEHKLLVYRNPPLLFLPLSPPESLNVTQ